MAGTGRRAEPVAHRADVTAAVPSGRAGGEQVGAGTPSRPAVMADVAIAAGVSHQTVSRVLNGHPHVRPATRDRVLAAIEQLGYRRNPSARALVTRRTLTIGVVAYNTTLFGLDTRLLIDVFNVYSRRDIWFRYYDTRGEVAVITDVLLLPILPSVALEVRF